MRRKSDVCVKTLEDAARSAKAINASLSIKIPGTADCSLFCHACSLDNLRSVCWNYYFGSICAAEVSLGETGNFFWKMKMSRIRLRSISEQAARVE